MEKNVKEIGNFSRKTKINIFVSIFIIFILIAVFTSIRQITSIIKNREQLFELQQQLNWDRQENIKLLAQEKSLYSDEAVEAEARKQFNMAKGSETNYFVEIVDDGVQSANGNNAQQNSAQDSAVPQSAGSTDDNAVLIEGVYKQADLWENLKIFYENELRQN